MIKNAYLSYQLVSAASDRCLSRGQDLGKALGGVGTAVSGAVNVLGKSDGLGVAGHRDEYRGMSPVTCPSVVIANCWAEQMALGLPSVQGARRHAA
jgi:hypothetical protein